MIRQQTYKDVKMSDSPAGERKVKDSAPKVLLKVLSGKAAEEDVEASSVNSYCNCRTTVVQSQTLYRELTNRLPLKACAAPWTVQGPLEKMASVGESCLTLHNSTATSY